MLNDVYNALLAGIFGEKAARIQENLDKAKEEHMEKVDRYFTL